MDTTLHRSSNNVSQSWRLPFSLVVSFTLLTKMQPKVVYLPYAVDSTVLR